MTLSAMDWTDLTVGTALTGALVLLKDVLWDEYLPDNPHVWIDVGTNVFAKLVSTFAIAEMLIPYAGEEARWLQPLVHGGINGGIKHMTLNTDNFRALSLASTGVNYLASGGKARLIPPIEFYTFESGFIEGASYNLVGSIPREFAGLF